MGRISCSFPILIFNVIMNPSIKHLKWRIELVNVRLRSQWLFQNKLVKWMLFLKKALLRRINNHSLESHYKQVINNPNKNNTNKIKNKAISNNSCNMNNSKIANKNSNKNSNKNKIGCKNNAKDNRHNVSSNSSKSSNNSKINNPLKTSFPTNLS